MNRHLTKKKGYILMYFEGIACKRCVGICEFNKLQMNVQQNEFNCIEHISLFTKKIAHMNCRFHRLG